MTYDQLCPPAGPGDGICVSYFLYQLNQFTSDHPILLGVLIGYIFANVIFVISAACLHKHGYTPAKLLDENPDYIKQYAPGYLALGYIQGQCTREDVYLFEKIPAGISKSDEQETL